MKFATKVIHSSYDCDEEGIITDAVDVDNDLRRIFFNQFACEPASNQLSGV